MAQQTFSPTPNVSTHADATSVINNNANDAETRISGAESDISSLQLAVGSQQTITPVSGFVNIDVNSGNFAAVTITEDLTLNISNSSAGDSGLVSVRQQPAGTGVLSFVPSYPVLNGDPNLFLSSMTLGGTGVGTISWYNDGTDILLYISDVT